MTKDNTLDLLKRLSKMLEADVYEVISGKLSLSGLDKDGSQRLILDMKIIDKGISMTEISLRYGN
jgi:hypothetical protein